MIDLVGMLSLGPTPVVKMGAVEPPDIGRPGGTIAKVRPFPALDRIPDDLRDALNSISQTG